MIGAGKVAVAAGIVAFGLSSAPAHAAKITFMYTAVTQFINIFVAKDQGMLEKRGLDVDLSLTTNGSVISAALVADSAQIGGPTPTVLLQANEQGLDLVVVAGTEIYPSASKSGIVAAAQSGIKQPKDLVGKKIGVPGLGGIIDVLSRKWVQSRGVDYHQVQWVEVGFPQQADALKGGLADAVASVDPFYSRVVGDKTGYDVGTYSEVIPDGTSPVNFVTTRAWAEKNHDAIVALRAALDEAVLYIKDPANDASVRASLVKATKLPPAVAANLALPKNFQVHIQPSALRFWVEVSHEQGLIKGTPDPASLIAP